MEEESLNTLGFEISSMGFSPFSRLVSEVDTLRYEGKSAVMAPKKETRESLADYVRRILKEKGLTFREVERLSDGEVAAGMINKIVNYGLENLTAKTIEALAKGLGENPESIFRLIIGSSPKMNDSEMGALFYNYNELSEEDKSELKLLLEVVDNEIERRRKKK
jgi:transcriptional regulator with XRE-family HTH domain